MQASREGPALVYAAGRRVGTVRDGVLRTNRKASTQFLRVPPAIGFDDETLVQAEQAEASRIEVRDTETGKLYQVSLEDFHKHSFRVDRGYGSQTALVLDYWQVSEN